MKYDLHIHSIYSKCSSIKPSTILKKAIKQKLDGIAITDHNSIKGAIVTKKLNKDKNLDIIVGAEIKTNYGDVVALYLNEDIKKRNLFDVIDEAKSQDAILFVAHPFRMVSWLKFKYPIEKLEGIIPAIETLNSRNVGFGNMIAKKRTNTLNFAKLGCSDAHIPLDIGKAYTEFDGTLRKAIKDRTTVPKGSIYNGFISAPISAINKRILTPLKVKKRWT